MQNKKEKFSPEEKDARRKQWEKDHPEEAQRRRDKKREVITNTEEELEEENTIIPDCLMFEDLRKPLAKKIAAEIQPFKDDIYQRREKYLKERYTEDYNPSAVFLSEREMKRYKNIVEKYYGSVHQEIVGVVHSLIVEGLRYPYRPLSDFTSEFLQRKVDEGNIPIGLWDNIWRRSFVPNNAVRLMLVQGGDGMYYAKSEFKHLIKIFYYSIFRHLELEYKRLDWAQSLKNRKMRKKEVTRKLKRIAYFRALISAYDLNRYYRLTFKEKVMRRIKLNLAKLKIYW